MHVLINTKVPHYGISNNIKGDTQHIIKYAGGKTSYRAYKNNKMISETTCGKSCLLLINMSDQAMYN
jgi:hypothetical protein